MKSSTLWQMILGGRGITLFALSLIFLIGCGVAPQTEDISEVSMRTQGGLLGISYSIAFRGDGSASCECNFFRLDQDNKPDLERADSLCAALYRSNSSDFVQIESRSKGVFTGSISKEKFKQIAQLINKNGFFSMNDKYIDEAVMDAPPDFTKVVFAGNVKEVADHLDKGGEKLSEIKRAIYMAAKETKWERGR